MTYINWNKLEETEIDKYIEAGERCIIDEPLFLVRKRRKAYEKYIKKNAHEYQINELNRVVQLMKYLASDLSFEAVYNIIYVDDEHWTINYRTTLIVSDFQKRGKEFSDFYAERDYQAMIKKNHEARCEEYSITMKKLEKKPKFKQFFNKKK